MMMEDDTKETDYISPEEMNDAETDTDTDTDSDTDIAPLTDELLEIAPGDMHGVLHQVRQPALQFVGRANEIERITHYLRTDSEHGKMVVLRGVDGVGKTELACLLVQELAEVYPDAQLMLEMGAERQLTPQRALQQIIHVFKPQAQVLHDLDVLTQRYQEVLQDQRVLIVADGVQDVAEVERLSPPPGCAVLITTSASFDLPDAMVADIAPFPTEEAHHLLIALCPSVGEDVAALATVCNGMPLTLRLCAGLLLVDAYEPATLAQTLQQAQQEGKTCVDTLLEQSYHVLEPAEAATLQQISVFPSSFDMEAARAIVNLQGITKRQEPPAQGDDSTTQGEKQKGRAVPPAGEQIMSRLRRLNLVMYDATIESYFFHDKIRQFAAAKLDDEAHAALMRRYAKYYAAIATDIEGLYIQGGDRMLEGLEIFDQERVHIEKSWKWVCEQQQDVLLLTFLCVIGHTGQYRYHLHDEYIPFANHALKAAHRLKRRGEECHVLNVLGSAHRMLGDVQQAVQYYKQALDMLRSVKKQSNEVSVLGNLGNAYLSMGDIQQATKHYKRSLKMARKYQDPRGECAALGQLGLAYAEQGVFAQAIEHYEQSLAIARKQAYRDYEGEVLAGMANVALEQSEIELALALSNRALMLSQKLGNRRDEGNALNVLGRAYLIDNDMQQAQQYQEATLAIAREIGERRLETKALTALGEFAIAASDSAAATAWLEQAQANAQAINDRRGEALSSWHLGLLHEQQDTPESLARAVELMQIRVKYEQSIGHVHADTHAEKVAGMKQA